MILRRAPAVKIAPDVHPRVVVIGGAPEPKQLPLVRGAARSISRFVDASDVVIRMNDLKNRRARWIGRKTDWQIMMNGGHPGQRYARKSVATFFVDRPKAVLWSAPPISDDWGGLALNAAILRRQRWEDLPQETFSLKMIAELRAALDYGDRKGKPSAGMAAIWWAIHSGRFEGHTIHTLGFGWQGWSGHAFDHEARLAHKLTEAGKLTPLSIDA